ncbi:hypothetical protein E2562_021695 [Oryza meyeriana var. granulata]|uniref:RNase H type-1 domain-containing protein n=1 Tax=Oryza meyeriana var. granulata TaxID=110450 RepID=A0A6G1DZP7_9ORYZ|nr:hypothetical protein E2562_021695 [Oryza meyeriana var. granulata]
MWFTRGCDCLTFGPIRNGTKRPTGIICGCDDRVVVAFAERTEHCTVDVVEARALIHGLRLVLACSVERIVVEGDDLVLVQLHAARRGDADEDPAAMQEEIIGLLSCFADRVRAYERPGTWTERVVMPAAVWAKVDDDRRGVVHERLRKPRARRTRASWRRKRCCLVHDCKNLEAVSMVGGEARRRTFAGARSAWLEWVHGDDDQLLKRQFHHIYEVEQQKFTDN